ncbi:MAG TPA: hypothetical protein VHT24_12735 [Pseudacidobacterium sp.]|jgi:hypothetical protein|nr:hypothetical protein [Pseudacidobacterium sp.]
MANLLNTASVMMCPHGGTVSAITSNTRVNVGGGPAVLATDTFMIAGCPFVVGVVPHPCMQVQWVQPDARSQVESNFTLSESSVGMCVAADMAVQGTVLINMTQAQVSGE